MTTDNTDTIDRAKAYADTLRRLADLAEAGVLPLPVGETTFSFWFRESQDGRAAALVAAEALGVTWQPGVAGNSGYTRYLRASASLQPAVPVALNLYLEQEPVVPEPVVGPPPVVVAFVSELNEAAGVSAVDSAVAVAS